MDLMVLVLFFNNNSPANRGELNTLIVFVFEDFEIRIKIPPRWEMAR